MYESAYVGLFMRLWGAKEGMEKLDTTTLLNNAQNPFDSLVGDVVGETASRFFIIEFKRDRAGVAEEKRPSEKLDRAMLVRNLMSDESLRSLCVLCHFACYSTNANIQLENYLRAGYPENTDALKHLTYEKLAEIVKSAQWPFSEFYDALTTSVEETKAHKSFSEGIGVTFCDFRKYIQGMYKHKEKAGTFSDRVLLGRVTKNGVFYAQVLNWEELVEMLKSVMARLKSHQLAQGAPSSKTPASLQ